MIGLPIKVIIFIKVVESGTYGAAAANTINITGNNITKNETPIPGNFVDFVFTRINSGSFSGITRL